MALVWRFSSAIARLGKNIANPAGRRSLSLTTFRSGSVVSFKLSDIGEGIRDVTVKEWFVKPGDKVSQFDNICEVQSDKASVTITSRYDGLIKTLHYKVDDVALVGDPLVDIELDDDNVDAGTDADAGTDSVEKRRADYTSSEIALEKALATPAVRKLAMENNIKLKDVVATGKGGRVLKEDILLHLQKISASSPKDRPGEEDRRAKTAPSTSSARVKAYNKHMWKTMTQALNIPHFVYSDECSVTKLMRYRNEVKDSLKQQGISFTLMPFFVKAASRALEKIPELNGWVDEAGQTVQLVDSHNIGVAMDTPEGLVVPNIKNVQNLGVVEIAKELNRLQELGRKASIPLNDLTDATFSLSNIGVVGGTYTKPVIVSPQLVIGAFGRARKLPRFDERGNVIADDVVCVSWAADHRVVDGVTMANFSNLWKRQVENPLHLLLGL